MILVSVQQYVDDTTLDTPPISPIISKMMIVVAPMCALIVDGHIPVADGLTKMLAFGHVWHRPDRNLTPDLLRFCHDYEQTV
jgi:hypothetical protein